MILYLNSPKLCVKIFCCRDYYYVVKVVICLVLASPYTRVSWAFYRMFIHPVFCSYEQVNVNWKIKGTFHTCTE